MSIVEIQPLQQVFPRPPTDLPEEDGVPLESDWHRLEMNLLIELIALHNQGRQDYFVGGNMFIYFNEDQEFDSDFRGPDFFYVKNAPLNPPRPYWAVWEEGGRYPDVIIELESPSTASQDRGIKKDIYEQTFHTSEYFIFDPNEQKLLGWRLDKNDRYQAIRPNDKGWLWCEQLGLWLGTWTGAFQGKENVYLRFFDRDGNLVPSGEERTAAQKHHAIKAKQRADEAKHREKKEKQRADEEKQRADKEKQRADTALAELESLKKAMKNPES